MPARQNAVVRPTRSQSLSSAQIRRRGGFIGGVANVGKAVYKSAGGAKGIARAAARAAIKTSAMAGGTAIALGAAITSDNLDNMLTWPLAGTAAGGMIGNRVSNGIERTTGRVANAAHVISDAYAEGSSSREAMLERRLKRQQKDFEKNEDNIQYFRESFTDKTDKEIKEDIMKRASVYDRGGIKNLDRIKDAIKLEDELLKPIQDPAEKEKARQQAQMEAMTMAKIREDLGEAGFKSTKNVRDRKASLVKQLMNNGMDEKEAIERADTTFEFMSTALNK